MSCSKFATYAFSVRHIAMCGKAHREERSGKTFERGTVLTNEIGDIAPGCLPIWIDPPMITAS